MSLVVDGVVKRFGPVTALDGLSFEAPVGQVFGFLGANGAGKTTTMRIALGVLRPDAGGISWRGRSTLELPRSTFGYLPEERGLYPRMRVLDQLVFFAGLHGVPADRARPAAREWLERLRIPELADRPTEELSKGNQQKVQFLAAVLHDPEVLLMDEPFTGLDPVNAALLREAFLELRERGRTLVFSTHQMETVEAMCESVAIIDQGRLVVAGELREVKRAARGRALRIGFETVGETDWLDGLEGVRVVRPGVDEVELALDPSVEPDDVLAAALARGLRVRRFEVLEPSLEQLFIERVGHPAGDDASLAPPGPEHRSPGDAAVAPAPAVAGPTTPPGGPATGARR